ncbi:hypothetical protein FRB99_006523 [Tulasnella sp. 403]|nr:hypothetical protein FRB99_006523 [Tulasnella sp. 403]
MSPNSPSPTLSDEGDDTERSMKATKDVPDNPKHRHARAHDLDVASQTSNTPSLFVFTCFNASRLGSSRYQIWLPSNPPPPPPASLDDSPIIPLATANIFSKLSYWWITPIIVLGFQRPLQAPDLWKVDPSREAGTLHARFEVAWAERVKKAEEWNAKIASGEIKPSMGKRIAWSVKEKLGKVSYEEAYKDWRERGGKKQASIPWALNDVLGRAFWIGGFFKVAADVCQLMGPLVSKALINYGKERYARKAAGLPDPGTGRGVAMAIGLFLLTFCYSLGGHQWVWRSMNAGILARATLISSLYSRGMKLTTKARSLHPNSALVNHMSTDISRIDFAAQWFHSVWTSPIQVAICLALLLIQIGPSALAGFAMFAILIPVQQRIMLFQFKERRASMKWTDQRAKLLQELLSAMRVIKYFCYEVPFLKRINHIRHEELKGIRRILLINAGNQAVAFSVPVLASVLAFVVYALAGHELDPAVIFTSLSLFQLLRQALMLFPRALGACSDAKSAVARLTPVYYAETLGDTAITDPSSPWAVQVKDSDFQWEETPPSSDNSNKAGKHRHGKEKEKSKGTSTSPAGEPQEPFALRSVSLSIPKGQLCAIAGPVGSGKSSLLLALIGEMKQTRGEKVVFGGRVGYCPQLAWIQNTSLRENVLFGAEYEEERYWNAIQDASLLTDLEMLPDGDLTEIGEKGITLFNNAILGALKNRGKTVILVTHALHFLHNVDYIYNVVDGQIVEQGTYDQLVENGAAFSKLLQEFSGKRTQPQGMDDSEEPDLEESRKAQTRATDRRIVLKETRKKLDLKLLGKAVGTGKVEGRLMKAEKRTTGSIDNSVYYSYLKAGKGFWVVPLILLCGLLMQGAAILNSYWLIWWQTNSFHQSMGWYMAIYAALGVAQAIFTFALGGTMAVLSFYACVHLHRLAVENVFHAPMSFFDTTPLGRILGVFGKDIDTIDNILADSLRMLALTFSSALGAIVIITYLLHYFVLAVAVVVLGYCYFAAYYGVSARELKRLDGSLRSLLYSHFAESLSGLSTIRAYGNIDQFLKDNEYYTDLENRALFLICTNQRWLAIRLDFMGSLLIFVVAMMSAAGVNGINPAQIGLVLVYCVSLTQLFGMVTRQSAEVENNMNAVERTVHYTRDDLIDQEPPHEIPETKPPTDWPSSGSLQLRDVVMNYRPGLPPVLKGITLDIQGGERIGVVGRTGAGKSSLMIALYRIVELSSGSIHLDGIDISTLGLRDLRSKISIIPQDPLLFSGTIRSNLDPFDRFDDLKLYDALRRAHLISGPAGTAASSPRTSSDEKHTTSRFTLDTVVEAEGANMSVGERSLLSLARALVRDEIKVVIMDEATASVDVETDSAIQETIESEFGGKTLLCIAHRLRTIIHYDRVLVLDSGQVAEFDTPLNLFQKGGIFRSLCNQSKITEKDILAD